MKDYIFQDCLQNQIDSDGKKPFWKDLWEKYKDEGYENPEQLRSAFKREKKRKVNADDMEDIRWSEKRSYEEKDGFINVICASRRLLTKDDIIDEFKIDMNEWEIDYFKQKTSEGYRKDRIVEWQVVNGQVKHGYVDDTGKMLVVPLYHLEVRFKPREYKFTKENINALFESLKNKKFDVPSIDHKQYDKNGITPVLPIADLHFGLIATTEVEGEEYNIDIAIQNVNSVVDQAKSRLFGRKVKEIVFVVGNDFFNSDNLDATTTKGTRQDTAYSWFSLIDSALELLVRNINSLREISNVRVVNVASNHDRHTNYSVVKMAEQYFKDCEDVSFDNRPIYTKYLMIGNTLLGLTHDIAKNRALSTITSDIESKAMWSRANHVVWLLAHLHNAMQYETEGVMEIYRLPAMSGRSRWTTEMHFPRSDRRAQMFIIDDEDGITDIMNIFPK